MKGALRPEDVARHAEMLAGRLKKNHRHLLKKMAGEQTTVFRLFDRDIPELRAVVDWYDGDLVVAEYEREQTTTVDDWVGAMGKAAGEALGVDASRVHTKRRRTRVDGDSEGRYGASGAKVVKAVREKGLRFEVELEGHIDTGLFADHRPTRAWVRKESEGKTLLNLYGYTGSFTVYAAAGGAKRTVTVDRSSQYLDWTRRNLGLNALVSPQHELVMRDGERFMREALGRGETWDLIVLDPPSFSTAGEDGPLDIQRDHRRLVELALGLLSVGGQLWFSTNHQRFVPDLARLGLHDVTDKTVAEEYRNRTAHQCWWTRR